MVRLFLASDVHTEVYHSLPSGLIEAWPQADILVLAGDIGNPLIARENYARFLLECKKKYPEVLLVPGNHEYYQSDYRLPGVRAELVKLAEETGVRFLSCTTLILSGIRFIGVTLWSLIDDYPAREYSQKVFRTRIDYLREFILDYDYLTQELLYGNSELPTVIITHHLPTAKMLHRRYQGMACNSAFSSEILEHFHLTNVKYWLMGHTHEFNSQKIGEVEFVCNPVGYPREPRVTRFSRQILTLDVPEKSQEN